MNTKFLVPVVVIGCSCSAVQAATSVGPVTFTAASTGPSVDVTGPDVVDWGYYTRRDTFDSSPNPDNTKAVSGIGSVVVTPGDITNGSFAVAGTGGLEPNPGSFTFSGGSSPASGTVDVGASWGSWAAAEANGFTIVFNDLGVGDHTVSLYVGHSAQAEPGRELRMDYSLTTADGTTANSVNSGTVSGRLIHGTFTMMFSTDDASADLTLTLDSVSGEAGSGFISGYVVETVPEPSSAVLLGMAGLALCARRRRTPHVA